MEILDGVFDGDDVLLTLLIDLIDHRGQRGRLSASRRSVTRTRRAASCRGPKRCPAGRLLERADLERSYGCRCHGPALHEDVRAEPREILDAEGKIKLVVLLELVLLASVRML